MHARNSAIAAGLCLLVGLLAVSASAHPPPEGRLQTLDLPAGRHVPPRTVQVWLPPGYPTKGERYPVLYMHDGQNAFARSEHEGSGFGNWGTDLMLERLLAEGRIRPAIVVAMHNTGNRVGEYMPQKAYRMARSKGMAVISASGAAVADTDLQSDNYLKFIVEELKPYIDAQYQTAAERDETFIMGSSMGGLVSLYAMAEYPEVFGAAAGLSTHWPIGDGVSIDYLQDHLPDPATHRVYLDRGTETLDATYPEYQSRVDRLMQERGYVKGRNYDSRVFEGAAHNEESWARRLHLPLEFLLGQ